MDWNAYVVEQQVAMKLAEARARSAHAMLVASLRPHRVDALALLGFALIRLGRLVRRRGRQPTAHRAPQGVRPLGSPRV